MPPEPRHKPIPLTNSIVKEEPEEYEESHSFVTPQQSIKKNIKS